MAKDADQRCGVPGHSADERIRYGNGMKNAAKQPRTRGHADDGGGKGNGKATRSGLSMARGLIATICRKTFHAAADASATRQANGTLKGRRLPGRPQTGI